MSGGGTVAVTFGEALLRLCTKGDGLFSESNSLAMHVGGSEANVAVGLVRLGMQTRWLSRIAENVVGRLILNLISNRGVDISGVERSASGRNGLYFLEAAPEPRTSRVVYDRSGTAFREIDADRIIDAGFLPDRCSVFHASGINLGLGPGVANSLTRLMEEAKARGATISFDTNYRANLFEDEDARPRFDNAMAQADILFVPARDARHLLRLEAAEPRNLFTALRRRYPDSVLVLTVGAEGVLGAAPDEEPRWIDAVASSGTERIGRGDALVAGVLAAYLNEQRSLDDALRWGVAAAALKSTIPGDLPLIEREEVLRLAAGAVGSSYIER